MKGFYKKVKKRKGKGKLSSRDMYPMLKSFVDSI